MTGPALHNIPQAPGSDTPPIDYDRLERILNSPAGQTMPASLRARMQADIAAHKNAVPAMAPADVTATVPQAPVQSPGEIARENASGIVNKAATGVMQLPVLAMQVGHDMTLGISPSPYSGDPAYQDAITRGAQIPIRLASGIGTMILQGAGLMRGLSYAGKVPIVTRALEFLPARVKEVGLGALINGGIDALRADGLDRQPNGDITDPSWLDPSAKIAKPLAEIGIPDRVALGIGGATVGAVLGPILIGIGTGWQAARETRIAKLSAEQIAKIKDGLLRAGVNPGTTSDRYAVAKTFIQNFRRVALNEEMAAPMADQLSREQYIASELAAATNANVAQPAVGIGDLAGSGFYIKPDAAVVLPNAASAKVGTVDAIKQAMGMVGKAEFEAQVRVELAKRSADPLAQAAATEEVARRIISRPPNMKSAYELGAELEVNPTLNTYAHQDATDFIAKVDAQLADMPDGPAKVRMREQLLKNQLFDTSEVPGPTVIGATPKELRGSEAERIRSEVEANARRRANELPNQIPPMEGGVSKPRVPEPDLSAAQVAIDEQALREQNGRLIAGIFRNNPSGVNVVTGISDDGVLLAAQQRLGVKLAVAKVERAVGISDYLIGRPSYNYPSFSEATTKLTDKLTTTLKRMAKDAATSVRAPKTTEAFILADGEPIRGGLNTSAMVEKMRLQKPVINGVERGDVAVREGAKFVRLNLADNNVLEIELPRTITKEQFNSIGKAIDTMKFDTVKITAADGRVKELTTPIGAVVQDHIAEILPPKSIGTTITPEMVAQYKRQGVFAGQAVVLPDGSVGSMVKKQGGVGYRIIEQTTGREIFVHKSRATILPTALAGEMQGSNLFASYLPDVERNALARLRQSIANGWAEPIKKYRDFESVANSRGYMSENLRGGKVRISKVNEGGAEPITFKDIPSALEWIRNDTSPMPELSSEEVTKLLGPDRNMGFIGGGGPPPRFNEQMPIDWKRMEQTMESLPTNRGPGFFQSILKPMMPFLRDLDERFGTQMYKVAYNMQTQNVAKQNFEALWYHGKDGTLPAGVKPLKEIINIAGPKADRELISDWMEVPKGTPDEADILARMTPGEKRAAAELRKWYDAMYPALGVGAPFVEDYMPRYREALQSGKAGSFQDFVAGVVGDPLKVPKGTDWVSDHIRNGFIDTYNKDAFGVATQYLRAGAKNRFMKVAQDEAREMVRMIADKNPQLALPLGNMLQAMGGFEFAEQRAMLNETFRSLMDKIPGGSSPEFKQSVAEKFTDWTTSLVYASTMGFRPSLALRNAKDIYVMAYPVYSGPRFNEAVGRALTHEGKLEAMAARAISTYGGGMLTTAIEDARVLDKLPEWAKKVQTASTQLYDSADDFTRAGTYFAAKFKAEDALANFARRVEGVTDLSKLDKLKEQLVKESRVYFHGQDVIDEFLRRASNSAEDAAKYAGKVGSDMTNFLYGRGMQARWMRSIGGRLLGQFGSWSLWYGDYLMRTIKAVGQGPYRADALAVLARHALVNAAILETGKRLLDVDLSRWASYGAIFYSGGPGVQVAMGASTLMRGLGDASSFGEDPLAQSRISQGSQMIWNTLPAFVPFHSAGRDVLRMATAYDGTDLLAATLGTRVTKDYLARRKVNILLGDPSPEDEISSTSPALGRMLNNMATGQGVQPVDLRGIPMGGVQTTGVVPPQAPAPQDGGQSASVGMAAHNRPLPSVVPPNMGFQRGTEVKKGSTTETSPSKGY